jgi:hypothetical protein
MQDFDKNKIKELLRAKNSVPVCSKEYDAAVELIKIIRWWFKPDAAWSGAAWDDRVDVAAGIFRDLVDEVLPPEKEGGRYVLKWKVPW